MRPLRCLRAALLAALSACLLSAPAAAQAQTELVNQIQWAQLTNSNIASITNLVNGNFRMVDIEPPFPGSSSTNFGGVFVGNTGEYEKNWWWYVGLSATQVTDRLAQNNARLIDVEPYLSGGLVRFAVVMIQNTGADAAISGWEPFLTRSQLIDWVANNNGRRIIDVQPYAYLGNTFYSINWVANSGSQQSPWWIYIDVTPLTIIQRLAQNNARLIDLEHNPGTDRMSCIMVPTDGNAWNWFYNVADPDELRDLTEQFGVRMIDMERYRTASGDIRYSFIGRRNESDLTVEANAAMRASLPLGASSGLYLRRMDPTGGVLAAINEFRGFEPASLMKTVHHYVACEAVADGNDSFSNLMVENRGLNGSCPTNTNPATRRLDRVLRSMMEQSSNTATEAIRLRYGSAWIEARAAAAGANSVELNHTIGCLCGMPRNRVDLFDLYRIHDSVVDGALGNVRENFYNLMQNESNFGLGSFNTAQILNDELASSSLSANEEAVFRAGLRFAFKGGGYTCIFPPDREEHRSRAGYLRLPFRTGCEIRPREYFLGAWVNDGTDPAGADDAVGAGVAALFRHELRAAIASWEAASCASFVSFCSAVPNFTGVPGRCGASGSPFLLDNDLTITGADLPPNQFGLLFYSFTTGFQAGLGGGRGNLCLGSPLVRFNDSIQSSGSNGTFSHDVDLTGIPTSSGFIPAQSGVPLHFQWWHRDIDSSGQSTSNTTDAIRATFI